MADNLARPQKVWLITGRKQLRWEHITVVCLCNMFIQRFCAVQARHFPDVYTSSVKHSSTNLAIHDALENRFLTRHLWMFQPAMHLFKVDQNRFPKENLGWKAMPPKRKRPRERCYCPVPLMNGIFVKLPWTAWRSWQSSCNDWRPASGTRHLVTFKSWFCCQLISYFSKLYPGFFQVCVGATRAISNELLWVLTCYLGSWPSFEWQRRFGDCRLQTWIHLDNITDRDPKGTSPMVLPQERGCASVYCNFVCLFVYLFFYIYFWVWFGFVAKKLGLVWSLDLMVRTQHMDHGHWMEKFHSQGWCLRSTCWSLLEQMCGWKLLHIEPMYTPNAMRQSFARGVTSCLFWNMQIVSTARNFIQVGSFLFVLLLLSWLLLLGYFGLEEFSQNKLMHSWCSAVCGHEELSVCWNATTWALERWNTTRQLTPGSSAPQLQCLVFGVSFILIILQIFFGFNNAWNTNEEKPAPLTWMNLGPAQICCLVAISVVF